jgi:hypothetical protein
MNFIIFLAFFYKITSSIRKTYQSFCVEEIPDSNNTDWKSNMVIKYKGFYNSTTTLVPKQKIPRNILGCDMRFPEKEDNAMEIEKIKKMYNKLDALKMLESNTIGIEDKMRIIDNYSILTPPELDEEPMEESDKKLLDSIRMRLNRTAQITEFWWFYDW